MGSRPWDVPNRRSILIARCPIFRNRCGVETLQLKMDDELRAAIADVQQLAASAQAAPFAAAQAARIVAQQSGAEILALWLADAALWGLASLRDLPDFDRLEEAGLLGKPPLPEELRGALGIRDDDEDPTIEADKDCEVDEEYAGAGLVEE
jgi:hypothetical protein